MFCGVASLRNYRVVTSSAVQQLVQREHLVRDACHAVVFNMARFNQQKFQGNVVEDNAEEPSMVACMCCHHWGFRSTHRRAKKQLLPMQTLRMYMTTLGDGARPASRHVCDARILHRLCKALNDKTATGQSNIYRTVFSKIELETVERVAEAPVANVHTIFALQYHVNNAKTLFVPSARVAEMIRDALSKQEM